MVHESEEALTQQGDELLTINKTARLAALHQLVLPLTREKALIILLSISALISRLWALGARVMSHDESLHVYFSWVLAGGRGFAHNPMMHGPFLFESTALVNFLFGASDFTSRLVPAILGVAIVVVIPQLLKPWLGSNGALAASFLLLVSPYVSYFSRYIRHDIIIIAWFLLAIVAVFRYLEGRREKDLLVVAGALALMFSTMEMTFIYLAILAAFLALRALVNHAPNWAALRASPEFDLVVVLCTLGAFFSSPIALLVLNPIWVKLGGAPFVDLQVLDTQGTEYVQGAAGIRLWGLLALFSITAAVIGLWWDRKRWPRLALLFGAITVLLFSTFLSNPSGLASGFIGSLGYWLSQHTVERGTQPGYYYWIVLPLYEYLPLLAGLLGGAYFLIRRKALPGPSRVFIPFVLWWAVAIFTGLSLAGEKMPWLSTHIALPFILLTGWWAGRLVEGIKVPWTSHARLATLARSAALAGMALLGLATLRTSYLANFVNYDYSTEFIDYAHGAPAVKWVLADVAAIAAQTGADEPLKIAYDNDVSWPMTWYLRDYPGQAYFGAQPNRQALDAPVVIAGPNNWTKVERFLQDGYQRFELIRMWWPIEDYKNLTWERIRFAISDPAMRSAIWDILWNRDYRRYAEVTQQAIDPPSQWPLSEKMRVYVRKDIDTGMLSERLLAGQLADLPPYIDLYANIVRPIAASQLVTGEMNAPRGMAVGPDGSIYVTDTGNSRILKYDQAGNLLSSWGSRTPEGQDPPAPGTFTEPWGIAVDARGDVYVADTWNHRVQKFDSQGNFLLEWGSSGLAADGPYSLWGPRGIAIDSQGRVYLTDTGNKRVLVYDSSGQNLLEFQTAGGGQLDEPVGIASGPGDKIYVADTWNQRVAIFNSAGQFLSGWPVQGWLGDSLDNKPYLAVDRQERVYLTDPEAYRVIVFSSSGGPLAAFGQFGPEQDAFGMPAGIAVDEGGTAWVVDAGNNRLGRYEVWGHN